MGRRLRAQCYYTNIQPCKFRGGTSQQLSSFAYGIGQIVCYIHNCHFCLGATRDAYLFIHLIMSSKKGMLRLNRVCEQSSLFILCLV